MLSKAKLKQIRSLEIKKYRNELKRFVAEGNKLIAEMLPAFECELLIAKPCWMATQGNIPATQTSAKPASSKHPRTYWRFSTYLIGICKRLTRPPRLYWY